MRVLVTGGAGYIGSIVTEELIGNGHEVVVYDNLVEGHRSAVPQGARFVEGDLLQSELLARTLRGGAIEAVVHMAAFALVGESVEEPRRYYRNNVEAGLCLLHTMIDCGVRRIVFSSSAAVYGEPQKQPIEEDDPTCPTNPYGETKLALERAMHWYSMAYQLCYTSLRYFNAAGASPRSGEDHDPETHLIPLVLQAAAGRREAVEVYGNDYPTPDGTCIRDYIHVVDLAHAHLLALEARSQGSGVYNLGCGGKGYSVLQVVEAARKVTGKRIPVRMAGRRHGDPSVLVAGSQKIAACLGWKPASQDLETIVQTAWDWMLAHPDGYAD
jgi:UDP-glucose 4-epimerase